MQWHRDHYTIDTDRERLDFAVLVRDLQTTYWAGSRSAETIERAWSNSILVFGLYRDRDLVGCARVVSDLVAIAWPMSICGRKPEARVWGTGWWKRRLLIPMSKVSNGYCTRLMRMIFTAKSGSRIPRRA